MNQHQSEHLNNDYTDLINQYEMYELDLDTYIENHMTTLVNMSLCYVLRLGLFVSCGN